MRLEKVALGGFKSFADKTEFVFDSGITTIVGPNGCGKSNVVDAVKWVLGEQSVKSLRSGQMADVIFSGSSSRKSMGSAEVTLVISHTRGELPIEADEIEISRRVFRSGESEYRINKKLCRLRDIRELFMDTGIGVKAYSIIEQGQIEQLLTASKQDRRVIFEEAAGISKYKAQKKEAFRKVERTEQNLLRLADIVGEVSKRLRSVKLAAGKARSYLEYTERLKELQVNYSLVEYDRIKQSSGARRMELEAVEEEFAEVAAEVSKEDAGISKLRDAVIETEKEINKADNSLVAVQSRIEQNVQRIEFFRSRIKELSQRKDEAGRRVRKLEEQRVAFEEELKRSEDELSVCKRKFSEKDNAVLHLERSIEEVDAACESTAAELEDEKSGIIDIVRRTAQLHNEVQSMNTYRSNLSNQKDRLWGKAENEQAELEKLLTEKAQQNARLGDIEKVLEELDEKLRDKSEAVTKTDEVIKSESKRLSQVKEAKSALSGELSILTDMEEKLEGVKEGVKEILESGRCAEGQHDYIEKILADLVVAKAEYVSAIEAALEGRSDCLVVSSSERLLNDEELVGGLEGRVSFVCMDKASPFVNDKDLSGFSGVLGRGVEFVEYDGRYAPLIWDLLGRTVIVENLKSAVELSKQVGDGYRIVTLKGEVMDSEGTIKLGPLSKVGGLISRRSRISQLEESMGDITREIESIEERIEGSGRERLHLEKVCQELRTAVYEANTEKMQVNSKIGVLEESIKRIREEQPLITSEIDMLEQQIAQSVEKEYNSKQKLEELEEINEQRSARIKELEGELNERKLRLQSDRGELTELKVVVGQIREQKKSLEQKLAGLRDRLSENLSGWKSAHEEMSVCDGQVREAERHILCGEAEVSTLFAEKESNQEKSRTLHRKAENLVEQQKQAEQMLSEKRAEQESIDEKIRQLRIELSQLEVKEQDLVERVRDELQIELSEAYEDYTGGDVDWEGVKEEISELRGKIERLGNVNLDAIDEQEQLEQRHEFLSKQVEDLNESKSQLEQLINRLNKKSREKFRETFEQVRSSFQEIFRKLFGGGRADVLLEETEDILEAGIEIIAKPPGKETRSISLLSGGEKSMTAIAMLFAVFKTKPSPFCFLDEIDAALDEANNERFNMLIREFQQDSQFIIITHSKRTMSMADEIYGITMQAKGVSKKIGVRFGEYEEEPDEIAVA